MVNATWIGTPNYTPGRGGQKIDHITLHIMAGFLAGTDSTFQDPNRKTSATYGIGGNGAIHQYVRETDTPWSDGDWLSNATGISIEHEGGLPQAQCTRACMDASAELCADIARRHGWQRLWHDGLNGNIYLHREIPGTDHTTCPDLAPNGLDWRYVIDRANRILAGHKPATSTPTTIAKEKTMGTTHIVFGVSGSLDIYIANIIAGTYQKMPNPDVLKTRLYVLKKAGHTAKSWYECNKDAKGATKGRSGYGDVAAKDLPAFGIEIK